jgi:hypothetical protein
MERALKTEPDSNSHPLGKLKKRGPDAGFIVSQVGDRSYQIVSRIHVQALTAGRNDIVQTEYCNRCANCPWADGLYHIVMLLGNLSALNTLSLAVVIPPSSSCRQVMRVQVKGSDHHDFAIPR